VPILFWWPGVTPTDETASMETVDIAPTLAAVVGVTAPDVDGRCVEIGQGCASASKPAAEAKAPAKRHKARRR